MSFRYSFQKIVDLKENEKTQAEWVLSGALGALRMEMDNLDTLHHEKEYIHSLLGQSSSGKVTVSELLELQHYLTHLERQIDQKEADVHVAEQNVNVKRDHLSTKVREEKVWTQARSKAYQQFQLHVLKKEQETLDEMAVTRHKKLS